jgi:hypothetical protein
MDNENNNDLCNEQVAEFQYNRHLRALGVTQVRTEITPKHRKDCYDLQIMEEGKWTGVAEVRSVNYRWDEIETFGGFMMDDIKLKKLKEQFYHRSEITGKRFWSKEIVFLFRCTKDETLWAINMRQIVDGWPEWPDAPAEWFKSDHGKRPNTKGGKQIPFRLMERVE